MNKTLKIAFSLLAALILAIGTAATVYAGGTVTYNADSDKFIFESNSSHSPTDLFSDFKGLMPGDSVKQNLTVKNDASDEVKVKLYVRSKGLEGSEELLSQLKLTVEKSEDNKMAYMFDISAENLEMKDWVCLGTLYSGGEVNLILTLDIPIELDNKFQDAIAYLDWEFKAEEFPKEPDDPLPPQTGDNSTIYMYGLLISVSVLVFFVFKKYKRTKLG